MILITRERKRYIVAAALILLIPLVNFSLSAFQAPKDTQTKPLVLTLEEKQWLKTNPKISIAFDGYFPPYSFIDDSGSLVGIAVEQLDLIADKLNIEFEVYDKNVWKDIYQAGKEKKVDLIATMVKREDRHKYFLFTEPYIFKSMAIITHNDNSTIRSRENLSNKTVAIVSQYQYSKTLLLDFPNITPYYVDNMIDAMLAIQTRQADAAILYLAAGMYIQKKHQLDDIKFAAYFDQRTANESIAVRKDWPIFRAILNKTLASISDNELSDIYDGWQTKLQIPVDYTVLIQMGALSIVSILLLLTWLSQLKYRNKQIKLNENKLSAANLALSNLKLSLERQVNERTASLSKSEEKYRHLVENLKDEYFFYQRDKNGDYNYVSPSITAILGYTVEYFLIHGHSIFNAYEANVHAKKLAQCNQSQQDACHFEIELINNQGKKHQFKIIETTNISANGSIIGVEGIAQDITQLNETQAQLNWLSYYDDLTQLANRRLFLIQFEQYIATAHRNNETLALLFLDIDRFKVINDNIGHLAGDLVLSETAIRIKAALRESDLPARIGGDEFTIILPKTGKIAAEKVARKLIDYLSAPYYVMDSHYVLGSSIGISLYPQDGSDTTTLIKQADSAMYIAKRNRLGIAFCPSDQLQQNSRHLQLEQQLRLALQKNDFSDEFELQAHYQAKVDLSSGKINGYEALIRWTHPELGNISPIEFIPIAEETGIIGTLTLWMIQKVALQALVWNDKGFDFGKLAINISAVELLDRNLANNIIRLFRKIGAKNHWFEFEVTESALMKAPNIAVAVLSQFNQENILIAIDDFGTGYSSLAYLKTLPASYIKIDRSFIACLMESNEDQEVIRAIIAMSHALGKKVIAEGVETLQQLEFLKNEHCDIAQGYWFTKPITASAVENLKLPAAQ